MRVGAELRQAREYAGLSSEQVAERTKIQLYKIEALENDNFERLPDGIYLDGIVRAYAHEVAVNPESLIERVRHERAQAVRDWKVGPGDLNSFPPEQKVSSDDLAPATIPNRAHEPARPVRGGVRRFVVPLLLLIAALGWGAYVYQANGRRIRETTADAIVSLPRPASPGSSVADATSSAPRERAIADAPATAKITPVTDSLQNVSGSWTLATHVESSSYARFEGLQLGYEIELEQAGDRVKGAGRKVTQNGDGIGPRAQTPISVDGTINGDRLTLTFNERGARRPTQGKFILLVDEGGRLRGRFSSTAAHSSGSVEAHRLSR